MNTGIRGNEAVNDGFMGKYDVFSYIFYSSRTLISIKNN